MTSDQTPGQLNRRAARYMTHEFALSMGYVRTPGGFRHNSFVHVLKPSQEVAKREGVLQTLDRATNTLVDVPPAIMQAQDLAGAGGGWVTWATWVNATGAPLSQFETTWVVPPAPATDSDQLIYIFNALEDQAGDDILQPVLQWGVSGAGGGKYWSIASWYVDSSQHAFCTPVIPVNPGDNMIGVLSFDGSNYKSEFQGVPGTSLIAQGLSPLVQATETLEVYGLTKSTDYPNTSLTRMTAINLQLAANPALLDWAPGAMINPPFGAHTTIVSKANPGGEIDLHY